MRSYRLVLLVTAALVSAQVLADGAPVSRAAKQSLQDFLRKFHANPKKMIDIPPVITDENGNYIRDPEGHVRADALPEHMRDMTPAQMDRARDQMRESIINAGDESSRENLREFQNLREQITDTETIGWTKDFVYPEPKDQAPDVLTADRLGLSAGAAAKEPWDDSYWPIYKGHVARRYADPGFPNSGDWSVNQAYVLANPASAIVAGGGSVSRLSAAEKYDLLVGDPEWNLTRWSWREGKKYFDKYGKVWSWMGICHGWSGAAHMNAPVLDTPVDAWSADGRVKIHFYPSDIRALTSVLWANGYPHTRFLGSRCKPWSPVVKDSVGRVTTPSCWDVNPGVWHLVVTNQMGIARHSMVMDAVWDYQVWNYPIVDYKFTYFNPQSLRPTDKVKQAIVPMENYTIDKFHTYRSPKARYAIGVSMYVTHLNETSPTTGNPGAPKTRVARYVYDLELDEKYNVIGGEWFSNAHPDFVWTFGPGDQAMSYGDSVVTGEWDGSGPIPEDWRQPAWRGSQNGEPMHRILDSLVSYGLQQH